MQQEQDRFKLDGACIAIHRRPNERVIVYNFNIPAALTQDPATFQTILTQLESDFPAQSAGTVTPCYFQLTAVYTIVHSQTNEERLWLGSFNPRARELSQVTAFRPFEARTFIEYCLTNTQPDRVYNKLALVGGRDSDWVFGAIKSIVVTVQCVVTLQHIVFTNYNHWNNHGRWNRSRKVFTIYYD